MAKWLWLAVGLGASVVAVASDAKPYRNYRACWACCAATAKHQPAVGKEVLELPKDHGLPAPKIPLNVDPPEERKPLANDEQKQDCDTCPGGNCSQFNRTKMFRWRVW